MNKKVLVILVAVLLLVLIGGGGAAAFFLLGAKKAEQENAEAGQAPAAAPAVEVRPSFLPLDPIAIYVQNEGRPRREVTIMVTLMVRGTSNIPEINEKIPMLRDAYIRALYPLTFKVPKFWQAKDLTEVVKVMRDTSSKVYPADWIGDVLITGVLSN